MSTIAQLKKSAGIIRENRPSYQEILGFYEQVFEAQEKSKKDIVLPPVKIEPALLKVKKDNNMPLIDLSQFQVDMVSAASLLNTVCDLAQSLETALAEDARCIKQAVENNVLAPELLFSAILKNTDGALESLSDKLNIPAVTLALFGYLGMAPGIAVCAGQLASYLEKDAPHNHGYCPVCGSQPDLAFFDEKGKRHLKCSFCSHQWAARRMGCALCRNSDPEKQHYFYSDEEKEYRVNLCDACGNYIKVVDLRQMNRYFYPDLELISTLHLDLEAREKGYVSSVSL